MECLLARNLQDVGELCTSQPALALAYDGRHSSKGDMMMKRVSIAAIGFAALSMTAPALAADMAVKAVPPPAPVAAVYSWTGFYIGANGGWGQSHGCVDFVTPTGTVAGGCADRSGGLVGGQ